MTRTRAVAAILLTALLAFAPPSAAAGGDNTAVAVNTKDGKDVFRLAFHINRVNSEVVDSRNLAVAFANCTDCQTVAIAIQVVLITSDPDVVTPENLALAINYQCSLCETLASAYQMVLTTGGPVRFTPEGMRRIAEIRRRLHELRRSDLSIAEIQAQVAALTAELREVVTNELVRAGRPPEPQRGPGTSEEPGSTTTTTTGRSTSTTSTTSSTSSTTSTSAPATTVP